MPPVPLGALSPCTVVLSHVLCLSHTHPVSLCLLPLSSHLGNFAGQFFSLASVGDVEGACLSPHLSLSLSLDLLHSFGFSLFLSLVLRVSLCHAHAAFFVASATP